MRAPSWLSVVVLSVTSCAHFSLAPPAKEGRIYEASEAVLKQKVVRWFRTQRIELQVTADPHVLVSRYKEHGSGTISGLLGGTDRPTALGSSIALDTLNPGELTSALENERTLQLDDRQRENTREFEAELQDAPRRQVDMSMLLQAQKTEAEEHGGPPPDHIAMEGSTHESLWGKDRTLYAQRDQWKVEFVPLAPNRTMVRVYKASSVQWDHSADQSYFIGKGSLQSKSNSGMPPVVIDRDPVLESGLAEHLDFSAAVEVLGEATKEHTVPADVGKATAKASAPAPADPAATEPGAEAQAFNDPNGCGVDASQASLKPGAALLLSDLLGTAEAVRSLRGVVCNALTSGQPVTVALSISGSEQARLNAYLASPGAKADRAALLAGPFWGRLWQDGRSSQAMVDLLEALRAWREQGLPVAALAVDLDVAGNVRAAYMAARILEHHRQHPERVLIGFLGNAHSSLKAGASWAPDYLPVGYRLLAAGLTVESYDVAFIEGTQWTCRLYAVGRLHCGTFTVQPGPRQREPRASAESRPFISRFQFRSSEGFDGLLFVGKVTASRPALAIASDAAAPSSK